VEGADLADWLLVGRKERCTPIPKDALGLIVTPEIAAEEEAAIAQDSSRARDGGRGWLKTNGLNLKWAEALEQERWTHCTRGTINRWFD
jgi:hypothetical protein